MRDVKADMSSESFDRGFQQHNGDGSIHVVIAIDQDRFAGGNRTLNSLDCRGHAEHEIGIVQPIEAGTKEGGGIL